MSVEVYHSFREVPLDDAPAFDHDDSIPILSPGRQEPRGFLATATVAVDTKIVVPFRPCGEGDYGDDVFAVKRANARLRGRGRLQVLTLAPPRQKRTWGEFFTRDWNETQEILGVPRTGRYDRASWRELAQYFDAYATSLVQAPVMSVEERLALGWLQAFYSTRFGKRYSQQRASLLGPAEKINRADCSGMVAGAMDWGKILPKVDWRWTNTDVQILFGAPVHFRDAKPLDIVFYGRGTNPSHEAVVVDVNHSGGRGNPVITIESFGSYPARYLPIDYRSDRIGIRRFV